MSALPLTLNGPEKRTYYLHAGRLFVSAEPAIVTTILGSCIAVCIWDERIGAGGINHFLLPRRIGLGHASAGFGTLSTNELIDRLVTLGASSTRMRAKVFGGASMMGADGGVQSVGSQNAEVAIEILRERHITVVASSVGGSRGRKVVFHTDTGETLVKVI